MSPRSHTRKHKEMDVSQNLISLEVTDQQLETVRAALDRIEAELLADLDDGALSGLFAALGRIEARVGAALAAGEGAR